MPVLARLPAPAKRAIRRVRRHVPPSLLARLRRRPRDLGPQRPRPRSAPVRLLVGPANFAGQGHLWARAAERHHATVSAVSFAVLNGAMDFEVDYAVAAQTYRGLDWQWDQRRWVGRTFSHVLVEAERPIFGTFYGSNATPELPVLQRQGLDVAYIAHGSDIRIPSRHAARTEWSPFRDADDWPSVPILERNATANLALLESAGRPVFVSTPDLVDDVPFATWCPVVVDIEGWRSDAPLLERSRPLVVHAPSNPRMKGSDLIDPILEELAEAGRIEYRRVHGVPPQEMRELYRTSDIVVDQFRLGSYGVAACEAMAAGRVVVAHVEPRVRERVRSITGLDLPVLEADPSTIGAAIAQVLDDRDAARELARRGPGFVDDVHDGRRAAAALGSWLAPTASAT